MRPLTLLYMGKNSYIGQPGLNIFLEIFVNSVAYKTKLDSSWGTYEGGLSI